MHFRALHFGFLIIDFCLTYVLFRFLRCLAHSSIGAIQIPRLIGKMLVKCLDYSDSRLNNFIMILLSSMKSYTFVMLTY